MYKIKEFSTNDCVCMGTCMFCEMLEKAREAQPSVWKKSSPSVKSWRKPGRQLSVWKKSSSHSLNKTKTNKPLQTGVSFTSIVCEVSFGFYSVTIHKWCMFTLFWSSLRFILLGTCRMGLDYGNPVHCCTTVGGALGPNSTFLKIWILTTTGVD